MYNPAQHPPRPGKQAPRPIQRSFDHPGQQHNGAPHISPHSGLAGQQRNRQRDVQTHLQRNQRQEQNWHKSFGHRYQNPESSSFNQPPMIPVVHCFNGLSHGQFFFGSHFLPANAISLYPPTQVYILDPISRQMLKQEVIYFDTTETIQERALQQMPLPMLCIDPSGNTPLQFIQPRQWQSPMQLDPQQTGHIQLQQHPAPHRIPVYLIPFNRQMDSNSEVIKEISTTINENLGKRTQI